jgi:hypothetical protein
MLALDIPSTRPHPHPALPQRDQHSMQVLQYLPSIHTLGVVVVVVDGVGRGDRGCRLPAHMEFLKLP